MQKNALSLTKFTKYLSLHETQISYPDLLSKKSKAWSEHPIYPSDPLSRMWQTHTKTAHAWNKSLKWWLC